MPSHISNVIVGVSYLDGLRIGSKTGVQYFKLCYYAKKIIIKKFTHKNLVFLPKYLKKRFLGLSGEGDYSPA